jgi:hypothetical protein
VNNVSPRDPHATPDPDHPEEKEDYGPVGDTARALVAATAPRLFAVVEEFEGDAGDVDARVAARGLAYADGSAQVAPTGTGFRMSLRSPERALNMLPTRSDGAGSLAWVPEHSKR